MGRPHFAAVMVAKGYAASIQQAFDEYLGENGSCYVAREDLTLAEGIGRILAGGGLPSLAHPCRISGPISGRVEFLEQLVGEMRIVGLRAIEVFHSDHSPEQTSLYLSLARRYALAVTGGSDFHGAIKPKVALGTGIDGNLHVPLAVLNELRRTCLGKS
jgi:predicted metal-dependent phosphoesterase TrpH